VCVICEAPALPYLPLCAHSPLFCATCRQARSGAYCFCPRRLLRESVTSGGCGAVAQQPSKRLCVATLVVRCVLLGSRARSLRSSGCWLVVLAAGAGSC